MSRFGRETLDELVAEHLASLLRLATRLTGSLESAEDIMQEGAAATRKRVEGFWPPRGVQDLGHADRPERLSRLGGERAGVAAA